jgi:hypothetical protein
MSDAPETPGREQQVMIQTYRILSGVALLILVVLEATDGLSLTVPLILLFGLIGIIWRVPAAPMLVLLFFAFGQFLRAQFAADMGVRRGHFVPDYSAVEMPDLVLAGAMVAFFAAQYRLYALRASLVPFDLRRKYRSGLGAQALSRDRVEVKRPRKVVSLFEAPTLILTLPLWVLLGQVLWLIIAVRRGVSEMDATLYRLMVLVWILGVPALVIASLFNYWKRLDMSPDEAQLFLQDTQWQQTGREQRTVGRFLAWARLRRKRREEAV